MMKKIKYWGIGLLILSAGKVIAQQNIQFTQYIFNSMSVNPAYAGYKEEWFAQLGLRQQWTGWDGAPKTGVLSVDGVLDLVERRHGVGLQITGDQLGLQSAVSAYANYALRLQLDRRDDHRLSLGIAGGVTQYGLDGSKLEITDPDDPAAPPGKIATWRPDLRLGVYYSGPKWYAGLSVHDLFAGMDSDEDFQFNLNSLGSMYRNIHSYFITGALFELNHDILLRPSILIKDDFRGPTALDLNAMFIFNDKFWIGGGYRTRSKIFRRAYQNQSAHKLSSLNAISGVTQLYVNPRFRIGYSYDFMINQMAGLQGGTHELTLGVAFGGNNSRRILRCYF